MRRDVRRSRLAITFHRWVFVVNHTLMSDIALTDGPEATSRSHSRFGKSSIGQPGVRTARQTLPLGIYRLAHISWLSRPFPGINTSLEIGAVCDICRR